MPKEYLPLKVDPFRFADNATRLHGSLLIKNMERLCPSLVADSGNAEIDIQFGVDGHGIRFLRGALTAHLALQCQRCMEAFDYEITSDFLLGIIQTEEEATDLSKTYDPLIVKGNDLFIQDVIEDELIISLPIVPMHALKDYKVMLPLAAESNTAADEEKENPFKVIKLLRAKRDK